MKEKTGDTESENRGVRGNRAGAAPSKCDERGGNAASKAAAGHDGAAMATEPAPTVASSAPPGFKKHGDEREQHSTNS
jgi:hypothetical protein